MENYKKVLVTGGLGFIGSHLVSELISQKYQVVILDNRTDFSNYSFIGHEQVLFINQSITDFNSCLEATKGVRTIFHLAAMVSVPESIKNPKSCHDTNVTGTLNLLNASIKNKVDQFIFSSSSAVYGDTDILPIKESHQLAPINPYGLSKLIGEQYCKLYHQLYGLKTVCLRYFNVFGKGQNIQSGYAAVIPSFVDRISKQQRVQIYGDGNQTRDFIYVKDVVRANIGCLNVDNIVGESFNVASGLPTTIKDLFTAIKSGFNKKGIQVQDPKFLPQRGGDIKYSQADISKIKRNLSFIVSSNLSEGILQIIE